MERGMFVNKGPTLTAEEVESILDEACKAVVQRIVLDRLLEEHADERGGK